MNRYAIILTHNRPELLSECVAAIAPQVDRVLVIDNASDPPVDPSMDAFSSGKVQVHYVPDQPPNLAMLWNIGFGIVEFDFQRANLRGDEPGLWPVAVLCDDSIVPDGWFAAVTDAMAATGAAAGCSNPWGRDHPPQLKTAPDADIIGRMPGWAFILDGTKGLRADESMHWWFFDSDLDWQARQAGGMVMIGGYPVPNRLPNDYTNRKPELAEQAGRDAAAFEAKHGWRPW